MPCSSLLTVEKFHDRWRDSITPPVRIISSCGGLKRKHSIQDEGSSNEHKRYREPDPIILHAEKLKCDSIPWYRDLLDKVNMYENGKQRIVDTIITKNEEDTRRIQPSTDSKSLHSSSYADRWSPHRRTDVIREEALARINAILAGSRGDYLPLDASEKQPRTAESNHFDIFESDRMADIDRRVEVSFPTLMPTSHKTDAVNSHWSMPCKAYDKCSLDRNYEVLRYRQPYSSSDARMQVKLEECPCSHSGQFCRHSVETPTSIGSMSLERNRVTGSPIRIPAKRLSPVDRSHPNMQFRNGPGYSEFHSSDQSAFSVFQGDLKSKFLNGHYKEFNPAVLQGTMERGSYDVRIVAKIEPNTLNGRRQTTDSHVRSVIFSEPRRSFVSVAEEGMKAFKRQAPPTDIIYDDMRYDCYKRAVLEKRLNSSSESEASEDSAIVTGIKDNLGEKHDEGTPRKTKGKSNDCFHLWEFLRDMLNDETMVPKCMEWTNREIGEFRLIKTGLVARLWGESKNRTSMTYEKMARAMRYYYKIKILEKVPNKRLHFRFGRHMLSKVLVNSRPNLSL